MANKPNLEDAFRNLKYEKVTIGDVFKYLLEWTAFIIGWMLIIIAFFLPSIFVLSIELFKAIGRIKIYTKKK